MVTSETFGISVHRLLYSSVLNGQPNPRGAHVILVSGRMIRLTLLLVAFVVPLFAADSVAPHVSISVDATETPRKIFHARLTIPAKPGTLTLYYPKWIPGEHGPTGPVQDLAGLKFTANEQTLPWRRDLRDGWTFHVEVPAGVTSV